MRSILNSIRMRFITWIKNQLVKLKYWNWELIIGFFGIVIGFVGLWVAYQALVVTGHSIDDSNQQRVEDIARNDTLFNIQLEAAKSLNNSLILQIQSLQEITSQQLEVSSKQSNIIKKQLDILEAGLDEQENTNKPNIRLFRTEITNSIFDEERNLFSPTISTRYDNTGKRVAYDLKFRAFVVYGHRITAAPPSELISDNIEPDGGGVNSFTTPIWGQYKNDFYHCFELSYFDKVLNGYIEDVTYQHYFKNNGRIAFYTCLEDEKLKLKKAINDRLSKMGMPLFDQ